MQLPTPPAKPDTQFPKEGCFQTAADKKAFTEKIIEARSKWWAYAQDLEFGKRPYTPTLQAKLSAANAEYFALGDVLRALASIPICGEISMIPSFGDSHYDLYSPHVSASILAGVNMSYFDFEQRGIPWTADAPGSYLFGGGFAYNYPLPGGFTVAPGIYALATNANASPERENPVFRAPMVVKGFEDLAFVDLKAYTPLFPSPGGVARAYVGPLVGIANTSVSFRDDITHYSPTVYGFETGLSFTPKGSNLSIDMGYSYWQSNAFGDDHVKLQTSAVTGGVTLHLQPWIWTPK